MTGIQRLAVSVIPRLLFSAILVCLSSCGMDRLAPALPDAIAGFTLADLEAIQNDERLTDDEKKEQIRAAVGAPDDADGDRLVEFLLTFTVP
jgi:hypothetical protein